MDDVFVIWITKKFVRKLIDQETWQQCGDMAAATEFSFFEAVLKQWICQRPLEEMPFRQGKHIAPPTKTGEHMGQPESSPTTNEPTSNQLAADRTWMAQERTLMAWIRTATSMISFGFTIYKFFEGRPPNPHAILTSRDFAILMIGFGLTALILATIQHLIEMRSIAGLATRRRRSIAFVLAILIAILGTIAFVSAVLRQ
jgi:putative membrane protein